MIPGSKVQRVLTGKTTLQVSGKIYAVSAAGFSIVQVPSSCGGGDFDVKTGPATNYSGPKPAVGEQAIIAGSGACSTSISATHVTSSAISPLTLSGKIAGKIAGGFTIETGTSACGSLHVYVTSSTNGAVPASGTTTRVTGMGSCSTYATATSIGAGSPPPPPPTGKSHVLTADYLGTPDGTSSIAWSAAAPYLTWAQTGTQDASAIAAAGIKTMYYVDPNRTNLGDALYDVSSSAFAVTCSGERVYDTWDGVTEWVMNPASSALRTSFANYVADLKAEAPFTAAFEDTAGALSPYEVYDPFKPSLPCDYSDSAWIAATVGMNQSVGLPIVINGLGDLNGHDPSINIAALNGSNTIGGNFEGCYSSTDQPKAGTWFWAAVENSELQVEAMGKLFECILEDQVAASGATDARLYDYASFLLTYNPATSVYRTEFTTPSGLHVMPETLLVPTDPTVAAPSSVSGLLTSGGTYARQFGECYLKGVSAGPCAVVVNSDVVSHPFPFTTYHHTLVISGNGVLDGGAVSTDGPAPPSSVPSMEAAIVFQ
jgi:hypothetical protein